jgi:hypothetical protein
MALHHLDVIKRHCTNLHMNPCAHQCMFKWIAKKDYITGMCKLEVCVCCVMRARVCVCV